MMLFFKKNNIMPPHARILDTLESLGFTRGEAEIYLTLLRQSPATGYAVAQAMGKAVGNVYKAIESLEAKGAIVTTLDESQNRLCRPVPVEELLDAVQQRTADQCEYLREHLPQAKADPSDDRVYRIAERAEFFQRCCVMLRSTRQFALATLCPRVAGELHDELAVLARRNVTVGVKVFEPIELPGATVIVDPRGVRAVDAGPGQWLFLTVDGREFIQGLLDREGQTLLQGAWTESALMTWSFYTGLSSDLVLAAVRSAIQRGESFEQIKELQERLCILESPHSSGKRYLIERYANRRRT